MLACVDFATVLGAFHPSKFVVLEPDADVIICSLLLSRFRQRSGALIFGSHHY